MKVAKELITYVQSAYFYYAVGIWLIGMIIGWIRIIIIRLKNNISPSQVYDKFYELLFWNLFGALLWPVFLILGIIIGIVWLIIKANDKLVDKLKYKAVESYSESTYRERPKKDNFST